MMVNVLIYQLLVLERCVHHVALDSQEMEKNVQVYVFMYINTVSYHYAWMHHTLTMVTQFYLCV